MIACNIPPVSELPIFGTGGMHLVLAHLLTDKRYLHHYQREAACGAHVILDNSAFELGKSGYSIETLTALGTVLGASEIIFPDSMRDSTGTLALVEEALHFLPRSWPFRPFYVPQGRDVIEWSFCFHSLVRLHLRTFGDVPFTMGCSRVYDQWEGGRLKLLTDHYEPMREKLDFEVHLLGWGRNLNELPEIARAHPWIRSIDTSKPFAWAMAGRDLSRIPDDAEEPTRPADYFTRTLTTDERQIAARNVERYQWAATGTSLPIFAA